MTVVVRSSMADLITRVRFLISDPAGNTQHFQDGDIQMVMDQSKIDQRYEQLIIAASIVSNASTNHQPEMIFADYYSRFSDWESNAVLQGNDVTNGNAWIILTPTTVDYVNGRFIFEDDVFVNGVSPGQYPPVFCTGSTFNPYLSAAQLLETWAASLTCDYDFSVNGRSFHRSQMLQAKLTLAQTYRRQAKPKASKMIRDDINPSPRAGRLLGVSNVWRL